MPEGVGYGPQNTLSVGKDLHVIGDHAYAYSGTIVTSPAGSADTTALKFTTGNYYVLGHTTQQNDDAGGDQLFFRLTMNGITVMYSTWDSASASGVGLPSQPWPLIIPPFTEVEIKVGSSAGVDKDFTIQIVGKVIK
jgi:hypothetical protein